MVRLGIDIGTQNVKAVIVDHGRIIAMTKVAIGFDQIKATEQAIAEVLLQSGMMRQELRSIIATGIGRELVSSSATGVINEFFAAGRGSFYLHPSTRTVIDVGAEEARAVELDEDGNVQDYVRNDRCAAGAGTFVEVMASALEATLDEFVQLSLAATKKCLINSQCVIFAESEVVSLMHSGTARGDIASAVHEAIAERVSTVARRVHLKKDVMLIGGVARNPAFVMALRNWLKVDILVPDYADYVSAVGAAVSD